MTKRIYITGIGIISAIGIDQKENYRALISGKHGISHLQYLNTVHTHEFPCGEIKLSNDDLADIAGIKINESFSRTALLGMIAAKEAVLSSGIKIPGELKTGLISATTVGGMDRTELLFRNITDNNKNFIVGHDCGYNTGLMADHLGIKDYISTISTACSSSANAIMSGAELIKNNQLDRVIAGGTDALSRFTLNGFNSLMILDKDHNKPFDSRRKGLNLGEGAAYLVLESEKAVEGRSDSVIGELVGYANANDAYHQTASSDEGTGAFLSMSRAMKMCLLNTKLISYINAHGTGTSNNDLTEAIAIQKLFGEQIPPFSSTKPFTGHTLGAAGAMEAVFSIFAINNNVIFPNLNFKEPMEEIDLKPVRDMITDRKIESVLSNSFGFGGNNSTLVISSP